MITPEQEKWIEGLSDRVISIVPYDPRSEELFESVKRKIESVLGKGVEICHIGSSYLGISGQNEIDVQIPVEKEKFSIYIPLLEKVFGEVRKIYPSRARFEVRESDKKIDLAIVDINSKNWTDNVSFHNYLRSHPLDLEKYRILKEECDGLTTREYYRRKIEFINEILEKANLEK